MTHPSKWAFTIAGKISVFLLCVVVILYNFSERGENRSKFITRSEWTSVCSEFPWFTLYIMLQSNLKDSVFLCNFVCFKGSSVKAEPMESGWSHLMFSQQPLVSISDWRHSGCIKSGIPKILPCFTYHNII